MFLRAKTLRKIESLQKRALRYLYDYYESPYKNFLSKSGKVTVEVRNLFTGILKSVSNIKPSFTSSIFKLRKTNSAIH